MNSSEPDGAPPAEDAGRFRSLAELMAVVSRPGPPPKRGRPKKRPGDPKSPYGRRARRRGTTREVEDARAVQKCAPGVDA